MASPHLEQIGDNLHRNILTVTAQKQLHTLREALHESSPETHQPEKTELPSLYAHVVNAILSRAVGKTTPAALYHDIYTYTKQSYVCDMPECDKCHHALIETEQ
jgi:hypothetical protein